jgi:hypothetical protein
MQAWRPGHRQSGHLVLDPLQPVTAQALLQGAQVVWAVALRVVIDQPLQQRLGPELGLALLDIR